MLVHSNFSPGTLLNKSIYRLEFVFDSLKCFHTRFCVPCPFKHNMHHSLLCTSLQSFHRVNVTVSMHMISTFDSELASTCTGKRSKIICSVLLGITIV